jgi:hypothetical protein
MSEQATLVIFSEVALVFTATGIFSKDLTLGMIGSAGGFFSWFAAGMYFIELQSGGTTAVYWYFFLFLALICLAIFVKTLLTYSFSNSKRGRWEEFEL